MAEAIAVRSIEAVEDFRRRLLVFISKAKPLLAATFDEVSRTRDWLRADRLVHWEKELRRRKQILQEAEETYFRARLSTFREATTAEAIAVRRAQAAVEAAEEKLRLVKRWIAEFEHSVWPALKQFEHLESAVSQNLSDAVRFLDRTLKTLDAYRGASPQQPARVNDENKEGTNE